MSSCHFQGADCVLFVPEAAAAALPLATFFGPFRATAKRERLGYKNTYAAGVRQIKPRVTYIAPKQAVGIIPSPRSPRILGSAKRFVILASITTEDAEGAQLRRREAFPQNAPGNRCYRIKSFCPGR
jgi:hypothetical protein